jgi:rSAM/selenodomain-associated transferase 1
VNTEIVIFGRPPVPGRVKTRLAMSGGPAFAAEVYRALLDHAIGQACASGLPVTLALSEPLDSLTAWRPPEGIRVESQAEGDLGTRMRLAFHRRFAAGADAVILTGSDLPGLAAGHFLSARASLAGVQVVLGPATDGGYWLVGQRAPGLDLFSGVPWSSPDTLSATRARLIALSASYDELPELRDLDTADDLRATLAGGQLCEKLRQRLEHAAVGVSRAL